MLYLLDKDTGLIHEFGSNIHDEIWVESNGKAHYYNLQNGCGCSLDKWRIQDTYAALPFLDEIEQPRTCLIDGVSKCVHNITDCRHCPFRPQATKNREYKLS